MNSGHNEIPIKIMKQSVVSIIQPLAYHTQIIRNRGCTKQTKNSRSYTNFFVPTLCIWHCSPYRKPYIIIYRRRHIVMSDSDSKILFEKANIETNKLVNGFAQTECHSNPQILRREAWSFLLLHLNNPLHRNNI